MSADTRLIPQTHLSGESSTDVCAQADSHSAYMPGESPARYGADQLSADAHKNTAENAAIVEKLAGIPDSALSHFWVTGDDSKINTLDSHENITSSSGVIHSPDAHIPCSTESDSTTLQDAKQFNFSSMSEQCVKSAIDSDDRLVRIYFARFNTLDI